MQSGDFSNKGNSLLFIQVLENDDTLYHDAEISALPAAARSF
jgi:hypothetical protein